MKGKTVSHYQRATQKNTTPLLAVAEPPVPARTWRSETSALVIALVAVSFLFWPGGDNNQLWGQQSSPKTAINLSDKQKLGRQGTQNPQAYELYLNGRDAWNKRTVADIKTGIEYFNQAIALDKGYAVAYSGLADSYTVLARYGEDPRENVRKANAAAHKALELDASLAHPHAVLATNKVNFDWNFAEGEAEYKKALELDPKDATARQWHAEDISSIGGREQEAIAEAAKAHKLDPMSPIISTSMGRVYITARQYARAIKICKKVANKNVAFAQAHDCLATAYRAKRMYPDSLREFGLFAQLGGDKNLSDFISVLDQSFRAAGWNGVENTGLEALKAQRNSPRGSSAYAIAGLYADLGNKDEAFKWLNTAYQERDPDMLALKTDFLLDSLRSDPRFAELVRKVGLPE